MHVNAHYAIMLPSSAGLTLAIVRGGLERNRILLCAFVALVSVLLMVR
jgi:hypothetical protein